MPDELVPISGLGSMPGADAEGTDVLVIVDVTDLTQAATGSTKKMTLAAFRTMLLAATVAGFAATDVLNALTVNATNVVATSVTGTLQTAAQPNVTSVGTLTSLAVSGTLAVTGTSTLTGNVGVGVAAGADTALYVRPNATLTGTGQYGLFNDPLFSSAATSNGSVAYLRFRTSAAAFTMTAGYGLRVVAPSIGAASAVTTLYGAYVDNQGATGITNAYGVYIAAQSGAATTNIGLYNAGTTTLVGNVGTGSAGSVSVALYIRNGNLTGSSQYGIYALPLFSSAATAVGHVLRAAVSTTAAAFTMTQGIVFYADAPTVGATSAITSQYAFYAANQGATGITNAYGVYIATQSGAATLNIGLYNAGTTTLVGAATLSSTLAVTGTSTLTGTVGIGTAPLTNASLAFATVMTAASGNANIIRLQASTMTANANSNAFYGIRINTITVVPGAYTGTTAYGLSIDAPTGAATNIGLFNAGTALLGGFVGIGSTIGSATGLTIRPDFTAIATTTQNGVLVDPTFHSTATVTGRVLSLQLKTVAAAFTMTDGYALYIADAGKGAGSTITNLYGIYIAAQTAGGTLNMALYNAGKSQLMGAVGIGVAPVATTMLLLLAGTTGISPLRIAHGVAPTSPVDGDLWTTTAGMFIRINGVTKTVTLT